MAIETQMKIMTEQLHKIEKNSCQQNERERIMAIETKMKTTIERLEKIEDKLDKISELFICFSQNYVRKDDDVTFELQIKKCIKSMRDNANSWIVFAKNLLAFLGAVAVGGGIVWQIKQIM